MSEFRLGIGKLATELTTARHQITQNRLAIEILTTELSTAKDKMKLATEQLTTVKHQLTQNQAQSESKDWTKQQ